jgi:elongation factor Ts
MSEVNATQVRALRDKTGAGMMDCKRALAESGGDLDKAVVYLREKGLAAAAKRSARAASEGLVNSYIHPGGKIGVLIEVNCETDFVARTPEFQTLVKDLSMQVAAASPRYVRREDVPADVVEAERSIYRAQAATSGKPAAVIEKIVDGKVEKFFADSCLLEQPFIRTESQRTVGQLVTDAIAQLGENIVVRRFARFQLGETTDKTA